MRLILIMATALSCLLAIACSGGDDDGDNTPSPPSPTAAPFDINSLTALVLNKRDVPADFAVTGVFSPGDPEAGSQSFTSYAENPTLRIQSTVARFADATAASQDFQRDRQVLPTFGAQEENFDVAGAEIAFLYRLTTTTGVATWAIVDNYVIFIQMSPLEQGANADPASTDVDRLRGYAETVVGRVNQLIDDPASVTPVPLEDFQAAPPPPTPSSGVISR
jgi:hypothetical protein